MSNLTQDVLELVEAAQEEVGAGLDEVAAVRKTTFRGGKKSVIYDCPPGYKLAADGRSCQKMSPQELRARKKGAMKGARKRHSQQGAINRARAKTMAKRGNAGL